MKKHKKLSIKTIIAALSVLVLLYPATVHAAPVSLSLSSTASSVQKDAQFAVTVNVGTTGSVIDALARVTYDSSKLSVVGVADYTSSPLLTDGPSGGSGNGYYTVDRTVSPGSTTYPTGSFTIARLTFRALGDSGTTTVGISASDSSVGDANDPANAHAPLSASGVTINLQPPAAPATAPNPGTASPTTPASRSSYTPEGETRAPTTVPVVSETPSADPALVASELVEVNTGGTGQVDGQAHESGVAMEPKMTTLTYALLGAAGVLFVLTGIFTMRFLKEHLAQKVVNSVGVNPAQDAGNFMNQSVVVAKKNLNIQAPSDLKVPQPSDVIEPSKEQ